MSDWKLVPVEPTSKMIEAATMVLEKFGFNWQAKIATYKAMLEAAPQPPDADALKMARLQDDE